jgi:hypothetical protein
MGEGCGARDEEVLKDLKIGVSCELLGLFYFVSSHVKH